MKIIFFGSRDVSPIIKSLKDEFDLSLVITTLGGMDEYSNTEKIDCEVVESFDGKLIDKIRKINPDLGVVANFRLIIPQGVIDLFPKGILNVHPSLLPKYRGPTPIQSTILNGDKITGVSIIKIDAKVDHGPLLESFEWKALPTDTFESLAKALFEKAAIELPRLIKDYEEGEIKPSPQDESKATFTKMLKKDDGFIDLQKVSEQIVEKMIRAYHPWPSAWTRYPVNNDKDLIIKFLPEKKVQAEGKKPTSYSDFINGYPKGKELLDKLGLS